MADSIREDSVRYLFNAEVQAVPEGGDAPSLPGVKDGRLAVSSNGAKQETSSTSA